MSGQISQGIVFHISDCLPTDKTYKVGQDVSSIIGVKHRNDEDDNKTLQTSNKFNNFFTKFINKYLYKFGIMKKDKNLGTFPTDYINKSDETRIQALGQSFLNNYVNMKCAVTEKIEGKSATFLCKRVKFLWFNKFIFKCYGRNVQVGATDAIYKYAIDNDVQNKLISFLKDNKYSYVAMQGEMTGPKIQGNIYSFPTNNFLVYKIVYDNKEMCVPCMVDMCKNRGFVTVPILSIEELTPEKDVDYWIKQSTGKSIYGNFLREGIVVRSLEVSENHKKYFSFKSVSPEYCLERGY